MDGWMDQLLFPETSGVDFTLNCSEGYKQFLEKKHVNVTILISILMPINQLSFHYFTITTLLNFPPPYLPGLCNPEPDRGQCRYNSGVELKLASACRLTGGVMVGRTACHSHCRCRSAAAETSTLAELRLAPHKKSRLAVARSNYGRLAKRAVSDGGPSLHLAPHKGQHLTQ